MSPFSFEQACLFLRGELTLNTVAAIWSGLQVQPQLNAITEVDCHALLRVDSSGLALLCQLQAKTTAPLPLRLTGVSANLLTLIGLYNLETVFVVDEAKA
ncbi:MAG: STAS domain-containing protein [Thiomicrospira sp.]|jgi:ABC-type transporter Mla MlaB component|nr:STAS domain-containing protein [Thiomicrospira sp.]